MASASDPSSYVYEGVWINWAKGGQILGATLTVNPTHASVLSPALALIISIAGNQLWRLFQFALHQCRATHKSKNFLYHQQQVTLRNTTTDLNTLWRLLRISFAWRHHHDIRICWESLPLVLWTTVHLALVILAGLFSSWLLHAGDEVLSRSPWCGSYSETYLDDVYSNTSSLALRLEYNNYRNSRYAAVQQHVDICHASSEACGVVSTNTLDATWAINADTCPFSNSVCHPSSESISFDTGFLSSAAHLGFNAVQTDRVSFRMVAECAPLDDAKHVTPWQPISATAGLPSHEVSDVHYGPRADSLRNSTFSSTKQNMECDQAAVVPPYLINSEFCAAGGSVVDGSATFNPISELQPADKDISLIMLMVNRLYVDLVDDPWFAAHAKVNDTDSFCLTKNTTAYTREVPVTTLGCTQQWQLCDTDSFSALNSSRCTPLQGIWQLYDAFVSVDGFAADFNPHQRATTDRFFSAAFASSFYFLFRALNRVSGAPLKARMLADDLMSPSLPSTQWQTEAKYWMDILLTYFQQNSMDFSTGQFAAETNYINQTTILSDDTGSMHWLCQNQVIRNTTYRNFSFFWLSLCVFLCSIITFLGLSIEDIIGCCRLRKQRYTGHNGKQDMWIFNSDLEMLSTISQVKDNIKWSRSPFGIPLAAAGAEAGIGDLRCDDLEAAPGHGIYSKNAKRQQTMTTIALSPERYRAQGFGKGSHRCGTCRSVELLTANSDDSFERTSLTDDTQNEKYQDFTFTNNIPSQVPHHSVPLLQTADSSSTVIANGTPIIKPTIKTQQKPGHGCDIIQHIGPIDSTANSKLLPFQYSHDIPSHETISAEPSTEYRNQGQNIDVTHAMYSFTDHASHHGGMLLNDSDEQIWTGNNTDSETGMTSKKKPGVWLWKRRHERDGPIC